MGIESIPADVTKQLQALFEREKGPSSEKIEQWDRECRQLHKGEKEGAIHNCLYERKQAASQKYTKPLSRLERCLQVSGHKPGDIQSCYDKEKPLASSSSKGAWETLCRITKGKGQEAERTYWDCLKQARK